MNEQDTSLLRQFIMILNDIEAQPEVIDEPTDVEVVETTVDWPTALEEIVQKMRNYMETDGSSEFAYGVESGMQRAADMIEGLLRRSSEGNNYGS